MVKGWRKLINNDQGPPFLFSHELIRKKSPNVHSFTLTNMIKIWSLQLDTEKLTEILSQSNPFIDFDDPEGGPADLFCLSMIFKASCDNFKSALIFDEKNCVVTLTSCLAESGLPIFLTLTLEEKTGDFLYSEIIKPLIGCSLELQKIKDSLINVIKKKDIEIEEYKASGAVLSLKHLETKKFEAEESIPEINEFFPISLMTEGFVESDKNTNEPETNSISIKKEPPESAEPSNIKIESDSNTSLSTTRLFNKRNPSNDIEKSRDPKIKKLNL